MQQTTQMMPIDKLKASPCKAWKGADIKSAEDLAKLVARIDKIKAHALACQDPAERMRYASMKRALEFDLARATRLKDFSFVPRGRDS